MTISYHAESEFSPQSKETPIFIEGSTIVFGEDSFIVNSILEYPTCFEMIHQKTGESHTVIAIKTNQGIEISLNGYSYVAKVHNPLQYAFGTVIQSGAGASSTISKVQAAMPGLLKSVNVKIGQTVRKGESIFVLEAMKMENAIKSPMNGIIKHIHVEAGSAIEKGFLLCTIGPNE